MNKLNLAVLTLALVSSHGMAANCDAPAAPKIPEGAKSKMEDMLAGQKAVKAFQTDNIDYMACLEKEFTKAEAAAKEGSDEEKKAAQATYDKAVSDYNAAVSQEEEVAGKFNEEIRNYKAANAK